MAKHRCKVTFTGNSGKDYEFKFKSYSEAKTFLNDLALAELNNLNCEII